MRAVVLNSYGGPEVLEICEIDPPEPGPDEVLVRVTTTALNRADTLQRQGLYPGPDMEHEVPGMEFAGEIIEIGPRVKDWAVGDRCMGIVGGGSYAEQLVIHERLLMAVPDGVSLADAAAIPEVFCTAFDALVVQGGLTSGRWALVHAGASGVGTAAIQIAKAIGANVVVTCSTSKVDACGELGANRVVDYTKESFREAVSEATRGRGVDVVLDVIGGDYTVNNIKCLRTGGLIIQVGVMGGSAIEMPLGLLLAKRAGIIGTTLRSRPLEEKAALIQRVSAEILPLFGSGRLRPVIDSRYPLTNIIDAHLHMEANANVGKILVDL